MARDWRPRRPELSIIQLHAFANAAEIIKSKNILAVGSTLSAVREQLYIITIGTADNRFVRARRFRSLR